MKNKLCKITLLATSVAMLSSALISNKVATSTKALEEDEYYLNQVISLYSPFPIDEANGWNNGNGYYCYVSQYDGNLIFSPHEGGTSGALTPNLVFTKSGDTYSHSDGLLSLNIHTESGVVDSITFLSGTGKWANYVGTYIPSGPINYQINFNEHLTQTLNRLAEKIGDEEDDWRSFIQTWVNDPSENFGLNYYDNFQSTGYTYTLDDVRQVKNSLYYTFLNWEYLFNAYPIVSEEESMIDEIRCLLDHLMPLKDTFAYMLEIDYDSIVEENDIKELVDAGMSIYEETMHTLFDTDENFDFGVYTNFFKAHLIIDSNELAENPNELTPEEFSIKRMCEKINGLTGIPWDYAMEMYESYKELKGDSYVTYVFDGYEDVAYVNDLYSLFSVIDVYNTLFYEFDVEENIGSYMLNNFGPLSYKLLDYIEAVRNNDTPNVKILAEELHLEIDNIFHGPYNIDATRYEEFKEVELSNKVKDGFDALDELIGKFEAQEITAAVFGSKLSEFKGTIDALFEGVDSLEETEGLTKLVKFLTRKVHELEHKFNRVIVEDQDVIIASSLLDYSVKFSAVQNDIDNCLNVKLTTLESYTTNLATYNSLMNDFSALIQNFVEFMGNLNLEDQIVYSFGYAIEATYLNNENLGREKFEGFIESKHNELTKELAILYTRLDDLDASYKLDDAHLKDYLDAVNAVLNDLNLLAIKAGEYKEVFGEIPSIEEDAVLISLTYDKGTAILNNIKERQKQYAIESIVLNGSDLTDRVNNVVENKGPVSECDALIVEINSLITEINDNFELLDEDERLSQTLDKMNENLEEVNSVKDHINATHSRNIALIVIGSVFGAVLFFVGGFFVAKLLSKKSDKNKEEASE